MVFDGDVHIVEEIQLLKNSEPIKNLLLSSEVSNSCTKTQLQKKTTKRHATCLCLHAFASDVVTLL